jgi:hypothetical protein
MKRKKISRAAGQKIATITKKHKSTGFKGMPKLNVFLDFTVKKNVIKLYYSLGPEQSFSKHEYEASEKLNHLIKSKKVPFLSNSCECSIEIQRVLIIYTYTFKI